MSEQEHPTTFTQEQVNALLAEQKRKIMDRYADYDTLKTKAAEADSAKAAADQAVSEAVARAEAAEGKVAAFEAEKQLNTWRDEVARETNIPAAALRGTTKEELEAHAAELKPLITGAGPVIPTQGDEPASHATSDERSFVRSLFGGGDSD